MISITTEIDELKKLGIEEEHINPIKDKQTANLISGYISTRELHTTSLNGKDGDYLWFAVINSKKPREMRSHKNNVALILYGKWNNVMRIYLDDENSALQWLNSYQYADFTDNDVLTYSFEQVM